MRKITFAAVAMMLIAGIVVISCKKDEFTEEDVLTGQKDIEKLRDSLEKTGGVIHYTVNIVDAGDAGFGKSTQGLTGAKVTINQAGKVDSALTVNGIVVFNDMRIGNAAVNVEMSGYTGVNYVADLTPADDPGSMVDANTERYAATMVPVFPTTGNSLSTISGVVEYETDLTNTDREPAIGVIVTAAIDADNIDYLFEPDGGNATNENQAGRIISIAFNSSVSRATTDGSGNYSVQVPSTANGVPIKLEVSDVAADQTLLMNSYYGRWNPGVKTVRTVFGSDIDSNITTPIPSVSPVLVSFADPTGTTADAPDSAATAVAVISKGGIESISINDPGEGYTQAPKVEITGDGDGAVATATISGGMVTSVTINNAGSDYTTANVNFIDEGTGADANVVWSAKVTNIDFDPDIDGGGGYDATGPAISFEGGGSGTGAAATANMIGYIDDIEITNPGSGFSTEPTIIISGNGSGGKATVTDMTTGPITAITVPGDNDDWFAGPVSVPVTVTAPGPGCGASGTANLKGSGRVASLVLSNPGSGYSAPLTVSITGGGGSGATAVATLGSGGSIAGIDLIEKGSGYTSAPTVTVSGGSGTGAVVTADIEFQIDNVTVTDGGCAYDDGYDWNDVTFDGAVQIEGTELTLSRSIKEISVSDSGTYTSAPTITFAGDGTGATFQAKMKYRIGSITLDNEGSGYTSVPTMKFTSSVGSGASAVAELGEYQVDNLILTNPGSGYTSPPNVSFDGTAETVAAATATVSGGQVTGFSITGAGSYKTAPPTVDISTSESVATGTANVAGGVVASINITYPGAGYTTAPNVEITDGGGSGATATATIDTYGRVDAISITNAGTGYTSAPNVRLFMNTYNEKAYGIAIVNKDGRVTGVTLTDSEGNPAAPSGNGYVTPPNVTFTATVAGAGSGATGYANIENGRVTSVVITNGGSGYTGQNYPGEFNGTGAIDQTSKGKPFKVTGGSTFTVEGGKSIVRDIYMGTGERSIED